jgi:hypothetical protein
MDSLRCGSVREGRVRRSTRAVEQRVRLSFERRHATRLRLSSGGRGWATEITIDLSGCTPRACAMRKSEVAERSTRGLRGSSRF